MANNNNNTSSKQVAVENKKKRDYDVFDYFFGWPTALQGARWDLEQAGNDHFIPRVDIHETPKSIVIDVEVKHFLSFLLFSLTCCC